MPKGRPKRVKEEIKKDIDKIEDIVTPSVTVENKVVMTKEQEEKKQKLHKIMNEINRDNKSIVLKFAKDEPIKGKLPFGIEELDKFTGGGTISGNFSIIYGTESVGKTSVCLYEIAEAQKINKICALIDLEHAFDKTRAEQFGVNVDELVLIENCNNAEDAMNLVIKLARENVVDLIVVDSIQAMTPKAENEGKSGKERLMEEEEISLLAKKMGKFLRRTATPIYKSNIGVTLVGQVRTGGIGTFVTHEELTGGRALKHWSLLTLFMRRGQGADAPTEKVDTGEVDENNKPIKVTKKIGFDCVIKIEKTKTNSKPEGSELHLPFYFKTGFRKK